MITDVDKGHTVSLLDVVNVSNSESKFYKFHVIAYLPRLSLPCTSQLSSLGIVHAFNAILPILVETEV